MQEQSQQTLLPGLKLFYGHPAFRVDYFDCKKNFPATEPATGKYTEDLLYFCFATASNSERISSEGGAVTKDTIKIAAHPTRNAGSSS